MMGKDADNILYVRMFGEFSVGGRLEELLFAGRDVQDRGHAMRSIVYNARKRLRAFCLPGADYIRKQGGVYRWTEEIPVWEDAWEMERIYLEMKAESEPRRKLELCLKACHCYTGEFLETQARTDWAEKEAGRYRELFCKCMEEAVGFLREKKDYAVMEELGLYAAKVHPLAEWETVTMEALAASGRTEEARKFYDDTVSFYFQEQGMRPSRRLTGLLRSLGGQMGHPYAVFDEIQEELSEDRQEAPGGYICSYPVFEGADAGAKRPVGILDAVHDGRQQRQSGAGRACTGAVIRAAPRSHLLFGAAQRRCQPVWKGPVPGAAYEYDP